MHCATPDQQMLMLEGDVMQTCRFETMARNNLVLQLNSTLKHISEKERRGKGNSVTESCFTFDWGCLVLPFHWISIRVWARKRGGRVCLLIIFYTLCVCIGLKYPSPSCVYCVSSSLIYLFTHVP